MLCAGRAHGVNAALPILLFRRHLAPAQIDALDVYCDLLGRFLLPAAFELLVKRQAAPVFVLGRVLFLKLDEARSEVSFGTLHLLFASQLFALSRGFGALGLRCLLSGLGRFLFGRQPRLLRSFIGGFLGRDLLLRLRQINLDVKLFSFAIPWFLWLRE